MPVMGHPREIVAAVIISGAFYKIKESDYMSIYIGENIKRLRRQKDITQEQLADFLNISNVAISKWERGETYPDISLLPVLAKYFNVTVDTLIGYDVTKIQNEVAEIEKEYWQLRAMGLFDKATDLIENAKQKYYDDYTIMYLYMLDIIGGKIAKKSVIIENREELLNISDKILNGCTNEKIRLEAINMKAKLLYAQGEKQKALDLLKILPDFSGTADVKAEQLFYGYETDDSRYWVKNNLYGLSDAYAIYLIKKIWFGNSDAIEIKIKNAEKLCDDFYKVYEQSKEISVLLVAHKLYESLVFRTIAYFGPEDDIVRIKGKELCCAKILDDLCDNDELLNMKLKNMCNGKTLVQWALEFLDTAPQRTYQRIRKSEKLNKLLNTYR